MPTAQSASIGSAVIVVNSVTGRIERAQPGTLLHVGIDVLQNETVDTAASSAAKLIFQDNTQFEIGPMSQVTLDRFVYDPDPSRSQVVLSVAKGAARFVTGNLPKSDYEIRTPAATIGIRGTIIEIEVATDGTTRIFVEEGTAFVTGAGTTVELQVGQGTIVYPHRIPSRPDRPAAWSNPLFRTWLLQAEQTPAGGEALIRSVMALHPEGGPALTDIAARLVEDDPALAPVIVRLARYASPAQQAALGAALGRAATYFANRGDLTDQQLIVTAMVSAPPLMQTAFANAGGPNNNINTVTTLTGNGNANLSTSNCISPSRPGNRC
jgi:hypothetical protein